MGNGVHKNNKYEKIEDKSDEELVGLTLKNPDIYQILMERYEDRLLRYIMRISAVSLEDAQDLLQEIYVNAYRNLNSFDPDLKFSSWIYRIAHNKVISHHRKVTARPKTVTYEGDNDLLNLLSSEEDLAKNLDRKYDAEEVWEILQKMEERYREVLVLKFVEDKNYKEISDILEKPMGTVATLINRAKKQFKNKLTENKIV